jgi:hypothetical protein
VFQVDKEQKASKTLTWRSNMENDVRNAGFVDTPHRQQTAPMEKLGELKTRARMVWARSRTSARGWCRV